MKKSQIFSCHRQKFCQSLRPQPLLHDSFVYRLGLQVFILARRVQLPYESPVPYFFFYKQSKHPICNQTTDYGGFLLVDFHDIIALRFAF